MRSHIRNARLVALLCFVAIAHLFAAMATPAHASILQINGDFDTSSDATLSGAQNNYTGTAAAPPLGTYWTPIVFGGPTSIPSLYSSVTNPIPLFAADGSATSVTLINPTFVGENIANNGNYTNPPYVADQPAPDLTADYIYDGAGPAVITFNNLPASAAGYDVYLYGNRGNSTGIAQDFTIGATTMTETNAGYPSTFISGVNYVEFAGVMPTAGVITVSFAGNGDGYGILEGFQLVTAPEPASLSLLAVGGLLMLRRRRA